MIVKSFGTHVVLVSIFLQNVEASWWYLGIASSYQTIPDDMEHSNQADSPSKPTFDCSDMKFLAPRQKEMCKSEKKLIEVIRKGASSAIDECQHQFRNRRWNCSTFNTTNVFGNLLDRRVRETAYIYGIFSSGVMYAVTRACAKGELDHCGCDNKVRRVNTDGKFEWGGCSDNIRYGARFSREFVDSNEMRRVPSGMMNLWNNEAGRKTVKEELDLVCKCHGVSGSCSIKICWRKMRSFRMIGSTLKSKFDGASQVKLNRRKNKLKRISKNQKKPTKKDLVYLEESPDFCEHNTKIGSLGTQGRECNKTSYGLDGCTLMCCGRGYHTIVRQIKEDCDCKFYWCCRVECKTCTHQVEMNHCN